MAHSLEIAEDLGIIGKGAAKHGLSKFDMASLAENLPGAQVLVRFRASDRGDWREIMSAAEFFEMSQADYDSIRDVMAVAE